ncbi:PucR family transcriptional regulator [Actinomadura craniellae]|uniref:PucR family transcriptional regulator n=1 Tax=Actinomadura craniellae TaxID=2231787 RepID=A0A365HD78_9ACTN|nr:helix-turn-helix domain-containing protein [Actinomadura craniellae]RAY16972.1 PucR family transcriptional regulator [Actinomadura craniellae]
MTETLAHPTHLQRLPCELAEVLRPRLPRIANEIVEEIRQCVPEFDRPLRGTFSAQVRKDAEQCLIRFVDRIADPSAPSAHDVEVPRSLSRAGLPEGCTMGALQKAYQVGGRAAWRHFAAAGMEAGFSAETMCVLAEAMFAYIEEIAAHSIQGYFEPGAPTGRAAHRRRQLLELLTTPGHVSPTAVHRMAVETQWRLPANAACVALEESWQDVHPIAPSVGPDVLMDLEHPYPFLLVPDADGPGRQNMLDRALDGLAYAVGPALPLAQAALSLRLARQTLALARRGIIPTDPPPRSTDHLSTLLLFSDEDLTNLMIQRAYAHTAKLEVRDRGQLLETLLASLATGGTAPELSTHLHVHPQTVRYRLRKLEELFGDRIQDPGWRFDMQLVLRSQVLLKKQRGSAG